MGKFSGCLLAADYDGTLADSAGQIPRQVREKIAYYISEGGYFTVCTGRTKQGFHAFAPELINAPVLLANGIMAYDFLRENAVFCFGIDHRNAEIVTLLQHRFPEICIEMYSAGFRSYAIRLNERSRLHFTRQNIVWRDVRCVDEAETPFVKIMLSTGAACGREVQAYLDSALQGFDLKYIPSSGEYVEIINKAADKGRGLLRLASCLGAAPGRVFAVGDGENDTDMLRAAVGFAPENACEAAKNAARYRVRSNDEGAVAHVIELLDEIIC